MTVTLQSSRFGAVEIDEKAIIDFPDGLIGLGGSTYTLLVADAKSPFAWLHSMTDPQLALPVTDPRLFFPDFALALDEQQLQRLGVADVGELDVYVTVRATPRLEDFVANLQAPVVIHSGLGHQVINQAPDSPLRAQLFPAAAQDAVPDALQPAPAG